jgi:elongation factor Ts
MTEVTAEMVRRLREKTGAGMMECKKALTTAQGDEEAAIEALRIAGQASAVKKGGRIAAEGVISVAATADNTAAVIAEVNCETDFVGRESRFKEFAKQVAETALKNKATDLQGLLQQWINTENTIEATRLALVAQLGENLAVRRVNYVQAEAGGVVAAYLHGGDASGARIATLVAINTNDVALAKDIAMHVAAMKPECISEADVPADRIAKEKEILMAQAQETNVGKPADILEKIISGRLNKFIKEITLVGQPFVKNPDQTVGQLLDSRKAKVTTFIRFEVGEGIEKKAVDFASEVMAQVKG